MFRVSGFLGAPVVPLFLSYLGVSLLKLNIRKKDTLTVMGLLGNLGLDIRFPDLGLKD